MVVSYKKNNYFYHVIYNHFYIKQQINGILYLFGIYSYLIYNIEYYG